MGFRRTSPLPSPTAITRLRRQLLATARARTSSVREGLDKLGSWKNLMVLMNGAWFGEVQREGATSRRALERRLRLLATKPTSLAIAATLERGKPVLVAGRARSLPSEIPEESRMSHIWSKSERSTGNVRLLEEEGHDFFLEEEGDAGGHYACILASDGHLLSDGQGGGDQIDDGDRVEVLGFVDRVVDRRELARGGSARDPPLCLAIRSGDELTLIVRKLDPPRVPK